MRNVFTPAFGGLPQLFFGREDELAFAQSILDDANSPYRAFFITGNRGCGKTTLLEKISQLARESGWRTIDVHSAHASLAIVEALAGGSKKTVEHEAHPAVMGVTLGGVSSSVTTAYTEASLGSLLVENCRSLTVHKGILITVDEIQKVLEEDAENLCAAVQLAMRKGLPIMLVLAGLPRAKEKIASYPGCTFMQRAYDLRIGCLKVDETIDAFAMAFARMPEFLLTQETLWEAGLFSQGYPYLMQLVGYHVTELAHERLVGGAIKVDEQLIKEAEPLALAAYRENVLAPILAPLSDGLSQYLRAMCEADDGHGRVRTGEVAALLGKEVSQISSYRQRLIERRLIEPDGHGYARFVLPHIHDYYNDATMPLAHVDERQQWNRQL
jgi:molybdopterin-guanine dinucleotide biosynthesis protein